MIGALRIEDRLGKRLVIILKGYPCSWGRCTFCPFVIEQSVNIRDIIETNRVVINEARKLLREGCDRVAVFNGGSFHELPFDSAVRLVPIAEGRVFEVEERPEFIDESSVKALLKMYSPRKLVIRVGFEVLDEGLRERFLRKGMPDSELRRVTELRRRLQEKGYPVEIWSYVLFSIERVSEYEVMRSVTEFKRLFDGVIAIKYRKYLPGQPNEVPVSEELARFLEANADLVDWGGEQWEIGGRKP